MKRYILMLLILLLPINAYAYSDKLIVGGQNIGIEVNTKGILVVGMYKVNDNYIAASSGIEKGDYITRVNNNEINNINDFTKEIENDDDKKTLDINYTRNSKNYTTKLNIETVDNEYKTGLYVKDKVSGIGTLTYIDPKTKKYGALGHEILDTSTNTLLQINDGLIYDSYITGISKASNGVAGEKEATIDSSKIFGSIDENTIKGVFGSYTGKIDDSNLFDVGTIDDVKEGEAQIYTVTDKNEIASYQINIDKINKNDNIKNINFTISDKELIDKTGGIIQGMSGSPIVQNGKLIGAVTHVIVENPKKGYGIFITNMLNEAEN